jgi:transcriptional antiterminator NusG
VVATSTRDPLVSSMSTENEIPEDATPKGDDSLSGEPTPPAAPVNENMKWYVVKVQSGREETIRDAIERRVKIEGLQESFGQILIPTEKVTEVRNNKRIVKEKKLFPGYVMVHLEFNDRMLYLFRETSGVGDFVGGGLNKPPQPMAAFEVERMLGKQGMMVEKPTEKSKFDKGDRVQVKDGTFAGMEGEVKEVLEGKGALRVELTIFGRPVPVELEYWQVDYA